MNCFPKSEGFYGETLGAEIFAFCFLLATCSGLIDVSLRIQVCPKKGISPTILFWRWDFDHQSYSRDGSGSLGFISIREDRVGFLHQFVNS